MFKTGMNRSLLTDDFFQAILDRAYGPNIFRAQSWSEEELDSSASILSNISSGDDVDDDDYLGSDDGHNPCVDCSSAQENEPCPMNDMTGHFLYKIHYTNLQTSSPLPGRMTTHNAIEGHFSIGVTNRSMDGLQDCTPEGDLWVVVKSKPIDTALIELTNIMAQLQGGEFAEEYGHVKDLTGFRNSHIREIELAKLAWQSGGAMIRISTKVYNILRNDYQQLYALCLEYLDPSQGNITHLNSTDVAIQMWSPADIHLVLRDLATLHAQFLGQEDKLLRMAFLENPTRSTMKILRPAYEAMVHTNRKNQSDMFSDILIQSMLDYLAHSDKHWATIENHPRTLIHGDFNTRNICLRYDPKSGAQQLCAYDWELACCHVPQRDVVEFLAFVLPPGSTEWAHYIEYHRLALRAAVEKSRPDSPGLASSIPSSRGYMQVAKLALMDFASLRVAMYGISNSFKQVEWLPRILKSVEGQLQKMGPLQPVTDNAVESKL
ncbi:hypothetical protein BG004_005249 [Podila humilis]|nr:hypothetical protein BG004_005249 [Podila humilis]